MWKFLVIFIASVLLVGCGGYSQTKPSRTEQKPPATKDAATSSGGYYLDDGPEANPPENLDAIPDATPRNEPLNPSNSKPYVALGQTFTPMKEIQPFKQSGVASWYGKRFHGKKTASGEPYDMYAMTAAHPTLPIPSYVRVTHLENGRSVIVRVNDRGPFKHSRIIDLSYAAAHKLRMIEKGSARVEIEVVTTDSPNQVADSSPSSNPNKVQSATVVTSAVDTPQAAALPSLTTSGYFVQAGAFQYEANANILKDKIMALGILAQENILKVYNDNLYRLKLGPFESENKASEIVNMLRKELNISGMIHQ